MANGLGEYFGDHAPVATQPPPAMHGEVRMDPHPTRTSVRTPPTGLPATNGMGEYFAQNGMGMFGPMGAYHGGPVPSRRPGAFRKVASRVSPFAGALGDASDVISDTKAGVITGVAAATTLTGILLGMGLRFGAGWIVGKALAPNARDERAYQWGGAIASVLFGSVGLGVEALVAQNVKR